MTKKGQCKISCIDLSFYFEEIFLKLLFVIHYFFNFIKFRSHV